MSTLAQTIAELTFTYAEREAVWQNRYNQHDLLYWTYKEGFYQKRIQELLKLISDEHLQQMHVIITGKLANPPGEAARNRTPEEVTRLVRLLLQSEDSSAAGERTG